MAYLGFMQWLVPLCRASLYTYLSPFLVSGGAGGTGRSLLAKNSAIVYPGRYTLY